MRFQNFLTEAEKTTDQPKKKTEDTKKKATQDKMNDPTTIAKNRGLVHIGYGLWAKQKGGPAVARTDGDNFEWLTKDEVDQLSQSKQGVPPGQASQKPTATTGQNQPGQTAKGQPKTVQQNQQGIVVPKSTPSDMEATRNALTFLGLRTPPTDIESEEGRAFTTCKGMIKRYNQIMNDQEKSDDTKESINDVVPDLIKKMNNITNINVNKRTEYLNGLINDYGIVLGNNGTVRVLKVSATTGVHNDSKIFISQTEQISKYFKDFSDGNITLEKETGNKSNIVVDISSAAKPNYSMHVLGSADGKINEILNSKDLGNLESKFHSLYVVIDDNGNFIQNGGRNGIEYLIDSFEKNTSLDKTIGKLKELESNKHIEKGSAQIVQDHKDRMQKIIKKVKDSKDSSIFQKDPETGLNKIATEIRLSYGQLMKEIYEKDEKIGSAMLKQMAETCAYETETANGEEVYMPVAGNFPIGDKLRIKRKESKSTGKITLEKVESVSVKSGIMGFPSNVNMYTRLQENKDDRDIIGNVHGSDYDIGIKNKFFEKEGKKDWNRIIGKQFGKSSEELYKVFGNYRDEMNKINPTHTQPTGPIKAKIKTLNEKYMKQITKHLNEAEITKIVGEANKTECLKDPRALINTVAFAYTIKQTNGYDKVAFNHTFFNPDGGMLVIEEKPDADLNNWKIFHRFDDDRGISSASYEGPNYVKSRKEISELKKTLIGNARTDHKDKNGKKGPKFDDKAYLKSDKFNNDFSTGINGILKRNGYPTIPLKKTNESKLKSFLETNLITEEDD